VFNACEYNSYDCAFYKKRNTKLYKGKDKRYIYNIIQSSIKYTWYEKEIKESESSLFLFDTFKM